MREVLRRSWFRWDQVLFNEEKSDDLYKILKIYLCESFI